MRALFLSPLKPPDHPDPSGDRTISRLFLRLLAATGIEAELASSLRSFCSQASDAQFSALEDEAARERARILAEIAQEKRAKPDFVFCYHQFYRAPDLVGPDLAASLGVPYLLAEASRAPKRASGEFARWHAWAERASDAAALIFCSSAADRPMLEAARPPGQSLLDLKPFIDLADWPSAARIAPEFEPDQQRPARLIAIGMMRAKSKLQSYRLLAASLERLVDRPWSLDIIGDGPARWEVEAAFARLGARIRFHGLIAERAALSARLAAADLFVWPAFDEAFGMVFLEAAAHGLPSIAGAGRSVADVVREDETGFILPQGDVVGFGEAIAALLADPARRLAMRKAARDFAHAERGLARAAQTLREGLRSIGFQLGQESRLETGHA